MRNTVVVVYDRFPVAEAARRQLIEAGFDMGNVELAARNDEAGPPKGNFAVGNGHSGEGKFFPRARKNQDPAYYLNFSDPEGIEPGSYVLTVTVEDNEQREIVSQITGRTAH